MMRSIALGAALVAGTAGVSLAAPIDGQIDLVGFVTVDTTAQTLTFSNPVNVLGVTGAYDVVFDPCLSCANIGSPISYNPVPAGWGWTFAVGLNTATFTSDSAVVADLGGGGLDFTVTGTLTLTGYEDTVGVFSVSTQTVGGPARVSFSSTGIPVPEPTTLAVLGMGLLGLAGVARRSRKAD